MKKQFTIINEVSRQRIMREVDEAEIGCAVTISDEKQYTDKQRGSLHKWCEMLADTLNDCGRERARTSPISGAVMFVPWTMIAVKEDIYKPVLESLTGKTSTEKQSTVNPSEVAMVISRHFGETGLICPAWPSAR